MSYDDRVLQLWNKVANSVCEQYRLDDLVCPPVLQEGLFTVAAADNSIGHNLSSSIVQSSFHGTAISLMQIPKSTDIIIKHAAAYSLNKASSAVSDILLPTSYYE